MSGLSPLYIPSPRGQCAVLLMAALREIGGAIPKREAISFIHRQRWFDVQPDDQKPYPSSVATTREPRWHTLIAWARKDSVLRDLVSDHERDSWSLTRTGRDAFERFHSNSLAGKMTVSNCFLWTLVFKRYMYPPFAPSPKDAQRPDDFYRDLSMERIIAKYLS